MSQIEFVLPNGNIRTYEIKNQDQDQVYYRNISKDLKLDCPEEFVGVYDLTEKNLVSKFYHKLLPERQYKLFYMNQAINTINGFEQKFLKSNEENKKLQVEIGEIKKRQEAEIQEITIRQEAKIKEIQAMNHSNREVQEKLKEAEKELKEAEKELKVRQDKIKDLLEDKKKLQYDLQQNNSLQEVQKKDMDKQLQEKKDEIKNLTEQCQRQAQDIENHLRAFNWERQSKQQVIEQFNKYQQDAQIYIQKWQQYGAQLEYEKKQIESDKIESEQNYNRLKRKYDQLENDLRQQKDSYTQLDNEKQNLETSVSNLKREIKNQQFKQNQELNEKKIQYDLICNEISELKGEKEKINSKLISQTNRVRQLQEELNQHQDVHQNVGQQQAEQFQTLQRKLTSALAEKEELQEQKENFQQKITELQNNLNKQKTENSNLINQLNTLEHKLRSVQEELNQDLNNKLKQIDQYKFQIENLSKTKNCEMEEYYQKQQDDQKRWQSKEQNLENEILRLKGELEKSIKEKHTLQQKAEEERKALQHQINESDSKMVEKEKELVAIQNAAIVPVYQFRIQRLVEQVPREYNKEIEFAIEQMMLDKVNLGQFLKDKQAQCKEQDFKLFQAKLNRRAENTLYNISDQDYRRIVDLSDIGDISGVYCQVPVQSSEQALDKYFLFKCTKCPNKKQLEGKIFGIKQCKKQDAEELETKETAIDNSLATLITQDFMNKFIKELRDQKAQNILEFKFRDQYILETKKHFKQYLQEIIQNQQIMNEGIKNFVTFIQALNDDQSNEFYDYIKEYQIDKAQPKDGNIIQAYLKIQKDNRLEQIYKNFNPDNIKKQLNHFVDYIGGNMKEMPLQLFYTIQEIEMKPDFKKFNGGHLRFETCQQGKFLSAFTYYSIIRSQRQLCISHLQGVDNLLYDPLVSTYDGFLDKLDQGYNEIRTMESKFLSETNLNKGIEYMKALGIKWS
ncbi:unnamed protein product [Paramecium sonneborni]|uniref:Alpha-type protein kinase domain-containing protein n=1 Tax=Paramecium sonneborni TaxID=65129 RepID=A0A8S1M2Z1_9CILI|nr:unnamed protein product [Paramecium sonneborni]